MITNANLIIPISLHLDVEDLGYLKLCIMMYDVQIVKV